MKGITSRFLLAALVLGCQDKEAEKKPEAAGVGTAGVPEAKAETKAEVAPRVVEPPPPPKLLEQPLERRLYSDRIEASSFLWTDWNKFQENYHPNYILDGDPATAWVEGADSSGAGEWVRIHVSPVEGATVIRLRVANGYQKSKALYQKNARLKKVEVVALPAKSTHVAELKDAMGWQEIAFEQPAGKLEAIELRAQEVYEGSKYTDLCVSDLEIFVTGLTADNPAFEKSKLASLLDWKKNRLAAAKMLANAAAGELPVLPGYRVVAGEETRGRSGSGGGPYGELVAALELVKAQGAPADAVAKATAALGDDFKGWVTVQVVARPPLELPEVDGLHAAGDEEMVYGGPEQALVLPTAATQGVLLRSSNLSAFDTKFKNPMHGTECKKGKSEFMRPPRSGDGGPVLRELLHVRCVSEETREGEATYMAWQVLEFDGDGNLVLVAGPNATVTWFDWKKSEKGAVLASGGRLRYPGGPIEKMK